MAKSTFAQRFRYWFDNLMSKGPIAMMSLLTLSALAVVVVAGSILWVFRISPEGEPPLGFIEGIWESMMRTMDSGTMCADVGWLFRAVGLIATLCGIVIVSSLIGVLSNAINNKMDELRKGKSFVIEQDHTLILGWSSKITTILAELVMANENKHHPRIVILADMDKVEMEDEIRNRIKDLKNTKVICRRGSPADLVELNIVNPQAARSIIILGAEESNPDPITIKIILAITNNPERKTEPFHIVAEIKEEKNMEVARMVGKDEIEIVLTDDVIAKIMVQTSRQSGVSIVYTELMDFDGAEIYFNEEVSLLGKTYAESLFAYEDSAVMGIQYAEGLVKINPPMDYVFKAGDKIIAATEDDDTMIVSKEKIYEIQEKAIVKLESGKVKAERILMLGWNRRAFIIIREMDSYVAPGSYMKVVSTFDSDRERILEAAKSLRNIKLEFQHGDTTTRDVIDQLEVSSFNIIQLLCYKDEMSIQDADAQTLISLLHIRRVIEETHQDITIVSEMLDIRNRDLAEVTHANDFIVSDKLISLLMSQVSENKFMMRVFDDIFNTVGSEIYLKLMSDYIRIGEKVNFYTILESARRKGETAIGYRFASLAYDHHHHYGIVLNPAKSKMLEFGEHDRIIVLSES